MAGSALDRDEDREEEKPLDPAAERLRQRMVRFLAINLGILFFAVIVVIAAAVYRAGVFSSRPAAPDTGPVAANGTIAIPSGAEIVSQSISGDRLSIHVKEASGEALLIFDLSTGRQLGRLAITRAVP